MAYAWVFGNCFPLEGWIRANLPPEDPANPRSTWKRGNATTSQSQKISVTEKSFLNSSTRIIILIVLFCGIWWYSCLSEWLFYFNWQMVPEHQGIEGSPHPVMENSTASPPSYEEANGMSTYQTVHDSTENVAYFLAEVNKSTPKPDLVRSFALLAH